MRAGDIFKFAHMSVFVTSIGVGVFGMTIATGSAGYAQSLDDFDDGLDDEFPPMEEPPMEEPPMEEPPMEEPPVEEPPVEEPPVEEPPVEEPPIEEPPVEEPPVEEPPYEEPVQLIEGERDKDHPRENLRPNRPVATPEETKSITTAIDNASEFCDSILDERYHVDCLGERLLAVARTMPRTGDYAEAREILIETGQKLRALAKANQSTSAPVGRASGKLGNTNVRTRPLVPVKRSSVKPVKEQAARIIQEAETKLLRSAAASDRRLIAYAQIAKAVGSNKKLLRSA